MKPNLFLIFTIFALTLSHDLLASTKKKNMDPELIKREEMVVMSRQLGVTCVYCHNESNFRDATLPAYKIANEHIATTKLLNEKGFKGKPQVDCYLCHKGVAKPEFREPAHKSH
jgi:hypothetical protein